VGGCGSAADGVKFLYTTWGVFDPITNVVDEASKVEVKTHAYGDLSDAGLTC